MVTPGLSLVGFMPESLAISYLRDYCSFQDSWKHNALLGHWNKAKSRLGPAIPGAGLPRFEEIPKGHEDYLERVKNMPRFAAEFLTPPAFKMVEIEPILVFQFAVWFDRIERICGSVTKDSGIDKLLSICLPDIERPVPRIATPVKNGWVIESDDVNLRALGRSDISDGGVMTSYGAVVAPASPWVRVVRYKKDRCYLWNGHHRAYGLWKAGQKYMPCILQETDDYSQTGVQGEGATFDRRLLESGNPPTMAHFTQDRTYPVDLWPLRREIHVSYEERVFPQRPDRPQAILAGPAGG